MSLTKFFKVLAFIVCFLLMLPTILLLWRKSKYYDYLRIIYTILQVALFILITQWYFWASVKKLSFMFNKHRFAFRKHATRNIIQIVVTYFAMWAIIIGTIQWVYIYACDVDREQEIHSANGVEHNELYNHKHFCQVVSRGIIKNEVVGVYSIF